MIEKKIRELDKAYKAYNENNINLAIKYYELAARKKSIAAIAELVYIFSQRENFDEMQLNFWVRKMVDAASYNSEAQLNLSDFYFQGVLGCIDNEKGMLFLLESASNGNAEAQYQAASLYCSGLQGVEISISNASSWLRRAYRNRHPAAFYELACFYKNKNKDTKKGLALLKKSAEMGFDQARDALNMIAIK